MLRIVKKSEDGRGLLRRLFACLLALFAAGILLKLLGFPPVEAYKQLFLGSLGTPYRLTETIHKAVPLLLLSLCVSVSFRMKFQNIGAEGQFYMGACAASLAALFLPPMPRAVMLFVMLLAAGAAGGAWCLLAAVLKWKTGANETLVTLMLNYIAIGFVAYLQYGPLKDPAAGGFPRIAPFESYAVLPRIFGVHSGVFLALILAGLIWFLFHYTKLGFEMLLLGENQDTARYAGVGVGRVLLLGSMLAGALAGSAGMIQASAVEQSLSAQLSGGLGFTCILTAWLAKLSVPGSILVSFLFAMLLQGSAYLQSAMMIPAASADVIQGVVLFFVLGSDFFSSYSFVRRKAQ